MAGADMAKSFEYKEAVGISSVSLEDAIKNAVLAISETHSVAWFEVLSTRGRTLDGDALEFQVSIKAGCKAR
jgi:flavin-binding protein dodecin